MTIIHEDTGTDWNGKPADPDGTMESSVEELAERVIGRKIVHAQYGTARVESAWSDNIVNQDGLIVTLDNGSKFMVVDTGDCCAYTDLEKFKFNKVDNAITGIVTKDGYTKWRVLADGRDVLEIDVSWSEGSGYYMYGFEFKTIPVTT